MARHRLHRSASHVALGIEKRPLRIPWDVLLYVAEVFSTDARPTARVGRQVRRDPHLPLLRLCEGKIYAGTTPNNTENKLNCTMIERYDTYAPRS